MNHYDIAYLAVAPFFLANAYYKRWHRGKYRRSLPGMFGANLPKSPLLAHRERVWLHSVSFGETVGAASVFRLLRQRFPDWEFLSTTTTETGQDQARSSMKDAQYHDFAPVDLSWKVRHFLDAYNPSVYIFFETEIWPNILTECGRRGMKVFLVNGDLSERSSRNYARLRSLFSGPLANVTAFLMQTEEDSTRIRRLLDLDAKVHVTGNVKFDNLPTPLSGEERASLRAAWGVGVDDFVVIAGSTHPGEEKLVYTAFERLRAVHPSSRLVVAPRHPERFDTVAEELTTLGARIHRLSGGLPSTRAEDTLLSDQMGVLARSFGAADVALVGGAWNPIGGHNLLEPAAHGVPVIHGPHMREQKDIMRIMKDHDASIEATAETLADTLILLREDPARRRLYGERGLRAAESNKGAAHRTVDLLAKYLS